MAKTRKELAKQYRGDGQTRLDEPRGCECDNGHKQNNTVCRWCWNRARRHWNDPEVCTCGGDGLFYAGPAKMSDFAKNVIPPGWFTVQRCDSCEKFPDDAAAAEAYYIEHRTVQDKQGFHHEIANPATRREPQENTNATDRDSHSA